MSGSRKIGESFPLIGKVFVELGQNFAIFSKNQKQCQLLGVGLIAIYRSLEVGGQKKPNLVNVVRERPLTATIGSISIYQIKILF